MKRLRALIVIVWAVGVFAAGPVRAADVHFEAAGPISLGYVGLYYGLVNPADDSWYVGSDIFGSDSTTWMAVADTGASASLLGATTQLAYGSPGIPLQPGVTFQDEGFGGFVDFGVTQPIRLMVAGMKVADEDTENHDLYSAYGPIGSPLPPTITMSASQDQVGLGEIDFDIMGMSLMQGRVLQVDPHHLGFLRLALFTMAGSLDETPPPLTDPHAVYVPLTMQGFFEDPPPVDVAEHPMLPMYVRHAATDAYASRTALFDTGSPVNFVSESFAIESGIDVTSPPDMTIQVIGIGPGQEDRPGWYVDSLALDLAGDTGGDRLDVSNSGVFVIPDEAMPGGLAAILGNNIFSPSSDLLDTTLIEWYVDTRDRDSAHIVLVLPDPVFRGDLNGDGFVGQYDLDMVLELWGEPVALGDPADTNGDGVVGQYDLDTVLADWGQGVLPGGSAPEPTAMAWLAMGATVLIRRRRR